MPYVTNKQLAALIKLARNSELVAMLQAIADKPAQTPNETASRQHSRTVKELADAFETSGIAYTCGHDVLTFVAARYTAPTDNPHRLLTVSNISKAVWSEIHKRTVDKT